MISINIGDILPRLVVLSLADSAPEFERGYTVSVKRETITGLWS